MKKGSMHFERFQKGVKDTIAEYLKANSPKVHRPLFDEDMLGLRLPDPEDYGSDQIAAFLNTFDFDEVFQLDERQEAHVAQTLAAIETFRCLKTEALLVIQGFDLAHQLYPDAMKKEVRRYLDNFEQQRVEFLEGKQDELEALINTQVDLLPEELIEVFTLETEIIGQAIPMVDFQMVAKWGDEDWWRKELKA
jgi:hypothetical protein